MEELEVHLRARGCFLPITPSYDRKNTVVSELNAIGGEKFLAVAYHSHFIASADQDNRLYVFNIKTGKYKTLAFAAVTIEAICFMHATPDQILLAFADKTIALVNWRTNTVIAQLQAPQQVHKILNFAKDIILVLESGLIVMIDVNTRRLLRELHALEPCVKLQATDDYIFILSRTLGLTAYANYTYAPIMRTIYKDETFKDLEWVSYCTFRLMQTTAKAAASSPVNTCFILLGKDGVMYVWVANLTKLSTLQRGKSSADPEAIGSELQGSLGIPQEYGAVISLAFLGAKKSSLQAVTHFIACLTTRGRILVLSMTLAKNDSILKAKWNMSALKASLDGHDRKAALEIGYVAMDDSRYIVGLSGGKLSIIDFDDTSLLPLKTLEMQSFIDSTVFKIPASLTVEHASEDLLKGNYVTFLDETHSSQRHFKTSTAHARPQKTGMGGRQKAGTTPRRGVATDAMSLYELAGLKPKEKRLNARILRTFLDKHGEFPEKYRTLIWRFLLQLPENTPVFASLALRGVHRAYENLKHKYPVKPDKVFERLQNVCSQLAHWSPIFAEIEYLPNLVFPFVLTFATDEIACLETIMTIFLWWGHSWLVTFPNPPLNVVDSISELLQFHDKNLYMHISKALNTNPGLIGWAMISSLFTEVFSKSDWYKIIDFLFAYYDQTKLLVLIPIAIMRELRLQILELGPEQARLFQSFFHQTLIIDALKVIEGVKVMARSTPKTKFVADAGSAVDDEEGVGHLKLTDVEKLKRNMAKEKGTPVFPLPKGNYPLFDGYPTTQKDGEIQERNRLLEFTNILSERKDVAHILEERMNEHSDEHLNWMMKQKERLASEAALRERKLKVEKQHLDELLRIEQKISERRVDAMEMMADYAKREMTLVEEIQLNKLTSVDEEDDFGRQRRDFEVRVAKLRAIADEAELKAQEKLRMMYNRRGVLDDNFSNEKIMEVRATQSFSSSSSGDMPSIPARTTTDVHSIARIFDESRRDERK